ncbi:MFS transporter [Actinotalea sp.]|uniref:MFS transporter n=1 Tax=Actinotalea sp. TaxID=1872145 RepID=UPI002BCCDF45|nr:MFS transporter [Actinotalea sp.]HQY32345.1 MFS transporter [Actinotalea sp.]HRA49726.1 MFS transporter [Actinotalea sp.]
MLFRPGRTPDAHRPRTTATSVADRPPARPAGPGAPREVISARNHLLGLYLLLGLTISSWLARLPTVRDSLDLTTGDLGTVMLLGAVGSLATILVAGAVVTRVGPRRTMLASALLFSVGYVLLGLGPALGRVGVLAVGVVVFSVAIALGNVPLNVESVVIERRMGRTVVPQFHAGFSVGAVLGSALGAAAAWAAVPVVVQFGVVAIVALLWRLHSVPRSVLAPLPLVGVAAGPAPAASGASVRRGAGLRTSLRAWRERRTLLLGVVVMSAALSEGSANNWLAIAVVDGYGQTEAVAAVVFGTFVASMTVARISGTWLIDRYGRFLVVALSGATSLAGLVLFALAPSLPWSVLGVVGWGLGAGLVIPIAMSAVSGDPLSAAGRVAVVSAFASAASIAAPPLIGMAAEVMGARHALLLITGVMLAGVLLSGTVRDESVAPARATSAVHVPAAAAPPAPAPGEPARPRPVSVARPDRDLADDDVIADLGGLVEPVGAGSCR